MKKLLLVVTGLCVLALPSQAEMNFYRAPNGQIIIEADDCQSASHLLKLMTPDDPPGGAQNALPDDPPEADLDMPDGNDNVAAFPSAPDEEPTYANSPKVQEGAQTILHALFDKEEPLPGQRRLNKVISTNTVVNITRDNFDNYRKELLVYVRDVNWKTGLQLTWSDMSFFRRLRMACTGFSQMNQPARVEVESYTGSLDSTIENVADSAVEALSNSSLNHAFAKVVKLSVSGLVDVLDKENPFLLLAIDDETYEFLVEKNPQVKTLFEDMYTFFKIRSVLLSPKYGINIPSLVRMSKIGKGNYFKTWNAMSAYAKIVLDLDEQNDLTPQDEKVSYLWRLNGVMEYIREEGRVEKLAAKILAQDPQNAALIQEMQQNNKKKPSRADKARKLIEISTQDEIKRLLEKYIVK